jgi:hypothetical protein
MPFLIVLTDPTLEMLIKRFLLSDEAKQFAGQNVDSAVLYELLKKQKDYLFAEGYNSKFVAFKRSRLGMCERLSQSECDELLAKRKEAQQKNEQHRFGPTIQKPAMIIPRKQN